MDRRKRSALGYRQHDRLLLWEETDDSSCAPPIPGGRPACGARRLRRIRRLRRAAGAGPVLDRPAGRARLRGRGMPGRTADPLPPARPARAATGARLSPRRRPVAHPDRTRRRRKPGIGRARPRGVRHRGAHPCLGRGVGSARDRRPLRVGGRAHRRRGDRRRRSGRRRGRSTTADCGRDRVGDRRGPAARDRDRRPRTGTGCRRCG